MISRDEGLFYMKARKVSIIALACLKLSKTEMFMLEIIYMHTGACELTGSLLDIVLICPIKVLYNFEISFEYLLSQKI